MDAQRDSASQDEPLIAAYRPLPGVFDEMMDASGWLRPHWRPFLGMLAGLGSDEINRRFAAADRHLRDSGVFYRVYEDPAGAERPWPLSHVPLLIEPADWASLEAGLVQRAELLEAVLRDVYGPASLVREGRLPAAVVAGNPEFLRPLVGASPPGGAYLWLCAVDVGRSPDGQWWVLGDRTQAPSGAGYALENRLALSRAMPDIYRALRVERLAPFFQAFQAELSSYNRRDDSRVCVLTPGPLNETYFEHAYLARYLGFLLVEGEDLAVRDDGVFIRTVSGLKRAEVLVRRLDSDFADPLELSVRSRLGVPGLVQAIRNGNVVIANALGSGLVEARALLGFLPALAPAVLGQELALPNVATWWLGDAKAREEIMDRLDELLISSAFTGDLPPHADRGIILSATLDPAAKSKLVEQIARRGVDFVAQEAVTLSTTPVWCDGRLEPRPYILRLFLARVGDGWRVMPGGFARVADTQNARVVTLQRGGRTADAWVLSDKPVAETTLLPTPDRIAINRTTGALPSRAASNLFWVARYVERAEATLRLVRALINRATESDEISVGISAQIIALLGDMNAIPTDIPNVRAALVASAALRRHDLDGALPFIAGAAQSAASVIRDRFSPDAWRALSDLAELINAPLEPVLTESAIVERINAALRIIASFSGFAQENMSQLAGWRFLELGRRVERALITCGFVRQFAFDARLKGGLDVLLELADSQITYRLRYVMVAARAPVVDLVVLDPHNPRSVVYQLDRIETYLAMLPKHGDDSRLSPPEQVTTTLVAAVRTADPAAMRDETFADIETQLMKLADVIATTYFISRERSESVWGGIGLIYDVRQSTVYHYASPVAYANHVLRLTPIDRAGQRVHAAALDIAPAPIERHDGCDFFGNRTTTVVLDQPHSTLTVCVAARIAVDETMGVPPTATPPWEAVRDAAVADNDLGPMSPAHYLFPSRQVSLDPEISGYAATSFPPERPVLDGALDLMRRIKADFTYEPGTTTVRTTAPMAFALRRGVCQDFAHIMISGLRGLGLPASYVSGYLRTIPPPGKERLEGADAMHAWVMVWCGKDVGWYGLDPTNAMPAREDHVVLAIGRDYADVAPVDGVIVASGGQRLEVSVSVIPVRPV